jgi:NAD(P)-dependent dehydrogenase (short-subunit alcohol dehydrogenase family)
MEIAGRAAVVTGAAAGIGAAVAAKLAAEGARVAVVDLDREAGAATAAGIGGAFVGADLADRSAVPSMLDRAAALLGGIDILVNNAGGATAGPYYPAVGADEWQRTLDLNLYAVMLASQLAIERMTEAGGGAVVNIASSAGLGTDAHPIPEYAAAKAAVVRLTAVSAPLRESAGIRVNCVCPGMVDTPSSRRSRARMTDAELAALPPVMPAEHIAEVVAGLIADDTLAGRTVVCAGGEPPRLLPVRDWLGRPQSAS